MSAAVGAYREAWTSAHPGQSMVSADDWCSLAARRGRYELYWRIYQNDVYRRLNNLSSGYKSQLGLYRHTRGCYNPASRIIEFGVSHLYSGPLDPMVGDGKEKTTCIPIDNASDAARKAIGVIIRDSRWEARKAIWVRWGYVCGDVALRICDDPIKKLVTWEPVHPGVFTWVKRDEQGNVIEYEICEQRLDPRPSWNVSNQAPNRYVEYRETADLDGDNVIFRTYLDGAPYAWTDNGAEWMVPYGFIPLVWTEHIDAGLGYGMSELELGRAKIDEVNDLGSKLHDQIRKEVEGYWFFAGVPDPKQSIQKTATRPTATNTEPNRQEMNALYFSDPSARPHSLVSPLKIAEVTAEIRQQLDSLEDDYPELRFERVRTGGTVSGEALRVARQPTAARIEQRRPPYDHSFATAIRMALAIGGYRGYEGFQGFGLDDVYVGKLMDLRIAPRSVFAVDEVDRVAEKQARFTALQTAVAAGLPLQIAMADLGYSEKDVTETMAIKDAAAKAALEAAAKITPVVAPRSMLSPA